MKQKGSDHIEVLVETIPALFSKERMRELSSEADEEKGLARQIQTMSTDPKDGIKE